MRFLIAMALCLSAPVWGAPPDKSAPKKIYCWDESGVRRCGDVLPAEASDQARTERSSKTGTITREVARPLTPEEIAAKKVQEEALSRQSELLKQSQRRTDVLLSTYPTEEALVQSFSDREKDLLSAIATMEKAQAPLKRDLVNKLSVLGDLELSNKTPSPKQVEAMLHARKQYLTSKAAVETLRNDIALLKKEQEETVQSYRQAKSNSKVL